MSTPSGDRPGDGQAQQAAGHGPTDPDAIRADIEATREQLGRTVDELSQRLDVPARAKESAARAKDTAVETYRESPPAFAGVGAGLAALMGLVLWRRRRTRRAASTEELVMGVHTGRRRTAGRARRELAARQAAARKATARAEKQARRAETKARRARRRKR
ncbi:DUF3618 domain-containing protein [Blastococcus goldschmidtiae]|uniref:DUF3618 domain-containing protein n=1 Tax=Blastococcus goldschmidtiae TaxID=3075546 RepID=A0ABU2KCL6_9ACTN|nr:DUF3618 domain-containing protein [Blastococcus sp. DSM 46792]MDT0277928.1 DUF3618 domain-containing protein [Blastococcus sp. DSM 46792]